MVVSSRHRRPGCRRGSRGAVPVWFPRGGSPTLGAGGGHVAVRDPRAAGGAARRAPSAARRSTPARGAGSPPRSIPGGRSAPDRLVDDVWADEPPATAREEPPEVRLGAAPRCCRSRCWRTAGGRLPGRPRPSTPVRFERLVAGRRRRPRPSGSGAATVLGRPPGVRLRRGGADPARRAAPPGPPGPASSRTSRAGRHERGRRRARPTLLDGAPGPGAPGRAADARALPLGPAGRGAGRLHGVPRPAGRRAGRRAGGPARGTCRCRSCGRSAGLHAPAGRAPDDTLPRSLTTFVGRETELSTLARRPVREPAGHAHRPGRRRQDTAGGGGRAALDGRTARAAPGWSTSPRSARASRCRPPWRWGCGPSCGTRRTSSRRSRRGWLVPDPAWCVLDNCEHVVAPAPTLLRRVLRSCPDATVLATSRRPLGVEGEYVLPLGPMRAQDAVPALRRARPAHRAAGRRHGVGARGGWSLPASGRAAAGDRAGGLAAAGAEPGRALGPDRRPAHLPRRRRAGVTAPGDAARHGHLEPRPAAARDPSRSSPGCGVFLGTLSLRRAPRPCAPTWGCHRPRCSSTSPPWSTTPCCCGSATPRRTPATGCWRRCGCSPSSAWTRPVPSRTTRAAHAAYVRAVHRGARRTSAVRTSGSGCDRLDVEAANVEVALAWAAEHDWALAVDLAVALWPYWDAGWGERAAVAYLDAAAREPRRRRPTTGGAWANLVAADMAANQGDARKGVPWGREAMRVFETVDDEPGRACAVVALGSASAARARSTGGGDARRGHRRGAAARRRRARGTGTQPAALRRRPDGRPRGGRGPRASGSSSCGPRSAARRGQATALRHLAVTAFRFGDLDQADPPVRAGDGDVARGRRPAGRRARPDHPGRHRPRAGGRAAGDRALPRRAGGPPGDRRPPVRGVDLQEPGRHPLRAGGPRAERPPVPGGDRAARTSSATRRASPSASPAASPMTCRPAEGRTRPPCSWRRRTNDVGSAAPRRVGEEVATIGRVEARGRRVPSAPPSCATPRRRSSGSTSALRRPCARERCAGASAHSGSGPREAGDVRPAPVPGRRRPVGRHRASVQGLHSTTSAGPSRR